MTAGDLIAITMTAKVCPDLLPHLISIFRLGYKQAQIDEMKIQIGDFYGINYGSEMKPSN